MRSTIDSNYDDDVIDATPISYCFPGTTTIFMMDEENKEHKSRRGEEPEQKQKTQRKRKSSIVERPSTTMEERKLGWAVDPRTRTDDRRKDKVFYHVQTQVQCRSLIQVHTFIKDNISPKEVIEMKRKKQLKEDISVKKEKLKAANLLKHEVIGSYNFKTKQIIKHEYHQSEQEVSNDLEIDKEAMPTSAALEGENISLDVDGMTNKASIEPPHSATSDDATPAYIGLYVNYEFI